MSIKKNPLGIYFFFKIINLYFLLFDSAFKFLQFFLWKKGNGYMKILSNITIILTISIG